MKKKELEEKIKEYEIIINNLTNINHKKELEEKRELEKKELEGKEDYETFLKNLKNNDNDIDSFLHDYLTTKNNNFVYFLKTFHPNIYNRNYKIKLSHAMNP